MSNHSFLWPQKGSGNTPSQSACAPSSSPTRSEDCRRRPRSGGGDQQRVERVSDRGAAGDRRHGSLAEDLLRQAGDLVRRRGQHLSALDRPRELSSRLAIPMLMPLSCSVLPTEVCPDYEVGCASRSAMTISEARPSTPRRFRCVTTRLRAQWPGQSRGLSPDRPSPWPSCLPRGSSSRPA